MYDVVQLLIQTKDINWKLSSLVNKVGKLGIVSTIVLFVCLCWKSSSVLQLLIEDVQRTVQLAPFPSVDVKRQLLKWKRNYRLVCQFTDDQLNRCFGWILLFFFADKFIGLICFTFQLYLAVSNGTLQTGGRMFDFATFYFENAIDTCILTAVCYRIRVKVIFSLKYQRWEIFQHQICLSGLPTWSPTSQSSVSWSREPDAGQFIINKSNILNFFPLGLENYEDWVLI